MSVHTDNDFNLRAERDINIEAGRNVNIKATGQNAEGNLINSTANATTGRVHVNASGDIEMFAGNDINQKAANDYKLFAMANGKIEALIDVAIYADNDFLVNSGAEIHLDTAGKVEKTHVSATTVEDLTTFDNVGVNKDKKSIMKRVPTQEPYAEHENLRRDPDTGESFTNQIKTDRERLDEREIE